MLVEMAKEEVHMSLGVSQEIKKMAIKLGDLKISLPTQTEGTSLTLVCRCGCKSFVLQCMMPPTSLICASSGDGARFTG
ncbi:hypothetical protein HU200_013473 [Digitaria exilis]|uniref:Uncharacterized protein n=1 Tax=Digitaria exilis TaxID=1010633 RepID=A0A835KMC5_9POAL|nr:hypothetical protein HU200_013473 [Digitaria exilis]